MTIFINKEGKSGFSRGVKISALRLHPQIGGIHAIAADTKDLYTMPCQKILEEEKNDRMVF
jgi:hypothetical protein